MAVSIYSQARTFSIISPIRQRALSSTRVTGYWVDHSDNRITDHSGNRIYFKRETTFIATALYSNARVFNIVSPAREA